MRNFCATIFLCLVSVVGYAQTQVKILPVLAPDIIQGQLNNGLRYFIKPNQQPSNKVEMRLVVNVGSMSEKDDELGVAHLLEHMAFRQTKNFKAGQVKAFLDSHGMRWGGDSNAFTSHENTVYILSVSSDDAAQALLLLADWAYQIEFDENELNTEREVVLNEERIRRSDHAIYQSIYKTIYPNQNYANRMPIGDSKIIKSIPLEKINAFYQREYQAQKMAILVSGDINPRQIETQIKKNFNAVPAGNHAVNYPSPAAINQLRLVNENEVQSLSQARVGWNWVLPSDSMSDADAALRDYQRELIGIILQRRLSNLAQNQDSALSDAIWLNSHGTDLPTRQIQYGFFVNAKNNRSQDALRQLYREIVRAKQFGFSAEELNSAFETRKAMIGTNWDNLAWANQLFMHYRFAESVRNPSDYPTQHQRFFDATQAADLQKLMADILAYPDQVVYALKSTRVQSDDHINRLWLKDLIAEVQAETLTPVTTNTTRNQLLDKLPAKGKIIRSIEDAANKSTLWQLSNGIEVLTIAPQSATENIGFAVQALGGLTALSTNLYPAARILPEYLLRAGLDGMRPNDIERIMSNKQTKLLPFVGVDTHGFSGVSIPKDIEALLQLNYLALTAASDDNEEAAMVSRELALQNMAKNDELSLANTLNQLRYQTPDLFPSNRKMLNPFYEASLAQLKTAKQQLYGNPGAFRFVITGVANDKKTEALLEQYLASLPTQHLNLPQISTLPQVPVKEVQLGWTNTGAYSHWQAYLPVKANAGNEWQLTAMADLLHQRLLDGLREKTGNIYWLSLVPNRNTPQGLTLGFAYRTDAAHCEQSSKTVLNELIKLRQTAPSTTEVSAIHDRLRKSNAERVNMPIPYALSYATAWLRNGNTSSNQPDLSQITAQSLHSAAQTWFQPQYWAIGNYMCDDVVDLQQLVTTQ
ncbi:M16 family metallopeptidase [uncultured Deefgea sp.]|uniref:M16 family metallopeptidase n=1 Tax=uncultured Deefgea sp. TaxID=1304914 RepID=UPI00261DDB41|nr:insulinase family protein [uncultured Deefgea sp.]